MPFSLKLLLWVFVELHISNEFLCTSLTWRIRSKNPPNLLLVVVNFANLFLLCRLEMKLIEQNLFNRDQTARIPNISRECYLDVLSSLTPLASWYLFSQKCRISIFLIDGQTNLSWQSIFEWGCQLLRGSMIVIQQKTKSMFQHEGDARAEVKVLSI